MIFRQFGVTRVIRQISTYGKRQEIFLYFIVFILIVTCVTNWPPWQESHPKRVFRMTGVEAVPESISFPKTEEEILKYWKGIWLNFFLLFLLSIFCRFFFENLFMYKMWSQIKKLMHFKHHWNNQRASRFIHFMMVPRLPPENPIMVTYWPVPLKILWLVIGIKMDIMLNVDLVGTLMVFPSNTKLIKVCLLEFLKNTHINLEYGIKGPEDVAKIGIAEYNRLCRSIVMRHSGAWRDTVSYSIFGSNFFWADFRSTVLEDGLILIMTTRLFIQNLWNLFGGYSNNYIQKVSFIMAKKLCRSLPPATPR